MSFSTMLFLLEISAVLNLIKEHFCGMIPIHQEEIFTHHITQDLRNPTSRYQQRALAQEHDWNEAMVPGAFKTKNQILSDYKDQKAFSHCETVTIY